MHSYGSFKSNKVVFLRGREYCCSPKFAGLHIQHSPAKVIYLVLADLKHLWELDVYVGTATSLTEDNWKLSPNSSS
jgi:hypothetical protein